MKSLLLICLIACIIGMPQYVSAQNEWSRKVNRFCIGMAYVELEESAGIGPKISIAWLKESSSTAWRYGWLLQHGEYYPYGITDVRNNYFPLTSVGYLCGYEIFNISGFALFANANLNLDFARNIDDRNLYGLRTTASVGTEIGFRWGNRSSRFHYELMYANPRVGFTQFFEGSITFGLNVRIKQ